MNRDGSEESLRKRTNQVIILPRSEERAISKTGGRNIKYRNLPEKTIRFIGDFVTTLVEEKWRTTLLIFITTYFVSWTLFAIFYYIIALIHGDLTFDEAGNRLGKGERPCINDATNFYGFILMSVETQVSTGYGSKYPTEECAEATILMIIQLTVGIIIDGSMIGILYSKIIRPPKYKNIKFSKKAVICLRDGVLCLIFQVCDFKQSHSISSKVRAYIFENKISEEGENVGKIQKRLPLENNGRIFLIWPTTICHFINCKSPFYELSPKDLLEKNFEIILSMTGISEKTGLTSQSRTSYLSREILWGQRFRNIINFDGDKRHFYADTHIMDETEPIETPNCSAKEMEELKKIQQGPQQDPIHPASFYLGGTSDNRSDDEDQDTKNSNAEEVPMNVMYP